MAGSEGVSFTEFHGVCHNCDKDHGPYSIRHRHCCDKNVPHEVVTNFGERTKIFPTIYPDLSPEQAKTFRLSHPKNDPVVDVLAKDASTWADSDSIAPLSILPTPESSRLQNLRCGNSMVYNLEGRAVNFNFAPKCVSVCDMSAYRWSNTLKDPRSWAVVQMALKYGIKHLGAWTAGNAGFSLAKLVYAVNRSLPEEERIRLYCYGIGNELPIELQWQLERWGARVVYFQSLAPRCIFTPEEVLERLNGALTPESRVPRDKYWEVSDGWDGLALCMYRLIGRQLCKFYKPERLVVPVGTGDLFYGLWLGRQDAVKLNEISDRECRFVAVVPDGDDSVLRNFKDYHLDIPSTAPITGRTPPVAPKLATTYTPLLLAMYRALRHDRTTVVRVSKEEQEAAAKVLLTRGAQPWVVAEPCAMLAFAALWNVAKMVRQERPAATGLSDWKAESSVMVVNSGSGIVGTEEIEFVRPILGSPITA